MAQSPAASTPQSAGAAKPPPRGQQQYTQADLNRIVMEYLNKKGFHKTEAMFRMESSNTATPSAPTPTPATSGISGPGEIGPAPKDPAGKVTTADLELKELRDKMARTERELRDTKDRELYLAKEKELRALRDQEEKLRRENDPDTYYRAYLMVRDWVATSLDLYRPELTRMLYPIFVHCYLELVAKNHVAQARVFLDAFKDDHTVLHGAEVAQIAALAVPEHLAENPLAQAYRAAKYRVPVSKTTMNLLLYFLHENDAVGGSVLIRIINQHIHPMVLLTRPARVDQEGEASAAEGLPGYVAATNEIDRFNDQPVSLGRAAVDPDVDRELRAELRVKDETSEPVNGKTLVDEYNDMTRPDSDAPEPLPLPMKDASDIKRMVLEVEDSRHRVRLGAVQAASPLVCMYTFHNTHGNLSTVEFNDDCTVVAGGVDSFVRLWLLDGAPLKSVFKRDPHNGDNTRRLVGHLGPVYGLSFSPDNRYLISGSEDKTARLWLLDTYSALVQYKGHSQPIWDTAFSPLGHYFATASHDQTARLWATDHVYPLRIFAGHINDVDCVEFHPNSNYVFTGSADKTARMWDVQTGSAVRIFMGHTGAINCMAVSPDGRWLASAGEDAVVNVWDAGSGRRLKTMRGHGRLSIYLLAFSRDGSVLVSGGADNSVRVWDVRKGTSDAAPAPEAFGPERKPDKARKEIVASPDHMTAYFTKKTPVYKVHFSRRNLCLAGGVLGM